MMEENELIKNAKYLKLCSGCTISYSEAKDNSESQVVHFLLQHGVISNFYICPICGSNLKLNLSRLTFRCNKRKAINKKKKKKCTFKKSVWSGSFLHRSKHVISTIFQLACAVLWFPPPRYKVIPEVTSQKTQMIQSFLTIREVFIDAVSLPTNSDKLGGNDETVELVEAKCRSYNIKDGMWDWAFGGINHNSGETFLVPVEEHNFDSLKQIIFEKIKPGTLIVTDCTKSLKSKEIVELTNDLGVRFITPSKSSIRNIMKLHWDEVRKGFPFLDIRTPPHSIDQLAEYLFKSKYPVLTERIHAYFVAAGDLYPPTPDQKLPRPNSS